MNELRGPGRPPDAWIASRVLEKGSQSKTSRIKEAVRYSGDLERLSRLVRIPLPVAAIYLASPYGFSPATQGFLQELKAQLRKAGHEVNDPWELGESIIASARVRSAKLSAEEKLRLLRKANQQLGMTNQKALDRSDTVVAVLDGPDVDSGTASEIGYAFARGKKIVGFRGDMRLTGENEGAVVNLQVQYWIEKSGGRIFRTVGDVLSALGDGQN